MKTTLRQHIIESNKAVKKLEMLGYKPQGVTRNMDSVAVLTPDGKFEYFKNYIESSEVLLKDKQTI